VPLSSEDYRWQQRATTPSHATRPWPNLTAPIDTFKLAALDNMRKAIDILSGEINRAQEYVERSRSAELTQARANGLVSELTLPASSQGA
jgi:hypothetical protein